MYTKYLDKKSRGSGRLAFTMLVCGSLLLMGFSPLPQPIQPATGATINVTITKDVRANDGKCSLREAVIAANTNLRSGSKTGECPAGKASLMDSIVLAPGAIYALTLNSTFEDKALNGDLDIRNNPATTDLTIRVRLNGKATIRQNAIVDDRVLDIFGAQVILRGLTLAGGGNVGSGGGIRNNGKLTLNACKVRGNSANWSGGGIFNNKTATLRVNSSAISNNSSKAFGGGIMNQGTLTVNNSVITKNVDVYGGGGINNEGTLTVRKTIFSTNSSGQGGALYNSGRAAIADGTVVGGSGLGVGNTATDGGGGLFSLGTLTVNGSTVSGNQAPYGGGLFNWTGGMLTISNSTVSGNSANEGGGLHNKENSTTVIKNGSIFSGNYAEWGGGGIDNWGTITITGSILRENLSPGAGDALSSGAFAESTASINGSCIAGNGDIAVFTDLPTPQNATGNWWGHASGPSGAGPGSGDSVSANIDFSGWLTVPPAICAP